MLDDEINIKKDKKKQDSQYSYKKRKEKIPPSIYVSKMQSPNDSSPSKESVKTTIF